RTVHTMPATDVSSRTGTSSSITPAVPAPPSSDVTSSSYAPSAGSAVTISAQLADANDNPVSTSGVTVTWSNTGAGGSFASATSDTDGSAVATVDFTTGTTAGTTYTVTADDGSNYG